MCPPVDIKVLQYRLSTCLDDVAFWMQSYRLEVKTSKMEPLWCATAHSQSQLPCTPLRVGSDQVKPTSSVRDLGIYINVDLSKRTQVLETTTSYFAALCELRLLWTVRQRLPLVVYKSLIVFPGAQPVGVWQRNVV